MSLLRAEEARKGDLLVRLPAKSSTEANQIDKCELIYSPTLAT